MRVFERKTYCDRFRLLNNMLYLLFMDLIRIYHDYYLLITVTQDKFSKMDVQDQKRTFIIYLNFTKINTEVKQLTPVMMKDFNSNMELHFYDIEPSTMRHMKHVIDAKDKENLGKSSQSSSGDSAALSPRS